MRKWNSHDVRDFHGPHTGFRVLACDTREATRPPTAIVNPMYVVAGESTVLPTGHATRS